MNLIYCPVCNSRMLFLTEKKNIFFKKKIKCGNFFYYKCSDCNYILLDLPKDINLEFQRNYRKKMKMQGDIVKNELSDIYYFNRKEILNSRVKKIDRYIKNKKDIFEIGCGGGYLLDFYKKKGYVVKGIEIDDLCVKACNKLGLNCIKGDFLKEKIRKKYSVVMAWHVLEHVKNINRFMEKAITISKKNGILIIEIPIKRKIIKKQENYDGHISYFCQKSFKRFIDKFKLSFLYLGEGIQKPSLLFVGRLNEEE